MGSPDWGKLVQQGRAKAIGVPWTEEELKAVYELKIPADVVRKGILTREEYNEELGVKKEEQGLPLQRMSKEELLALAEQLGLQVPEGTHRMAVVSMILTHKKKEANLPDEEKKDTLVQESLLP